MQRIDVAEKGNVMKNFDLELAVRPFNTDEENIVDNIGSVVVLVVFGLIMFL